LISFGLDYDIETSPRSPAFYGTLSPIDIGGGSNNADGEADNFG